MTKKQRIVFLASILCFPLSDIQAESGTLINYPQEITDKEIQISFEVDSTWHLIEGTASGVHGKVWLENPLNQASIRGELQIPVNLVSTDMEARDERLREVMDESHYPEVHFQVTSVGRACLPVTINVGESCTTRIGGNLRVKDVEKFVEIPATLSADEDEYKISGDYVFNWEDYGVEDPSILIAKVEKDVRVHFVVKLKRA